MKKNLVFAFFILILSFSACSNKSSEYMKPQNKKIANFYTSKLNDLFVNSEEFEVKILDMDYYTYYSVNKEDFIIVSEFIKFLNEEDFSLNDTSTYDNLRPKFKLIVEFKEDKYVFNIYDENSSTLYPWDGIYEEDVFTMSNVPDYYNLYKFCNYVIKVSKGFEG